MTKNRAVKLNIVVGLFSQVLSIFVNYLTKQAVFSYLGADYMGMQTVFGNFCDIIIIAFSGVGTTLLVRMYPALSKNDGQALSALWNYFNRASRIITAVSAGIGVVASFAVVWVLESSFSAGTVIGLFLLYLAAILIYNRFRMDYYYLLAHEKMYLTILIYGVGDLVIMFAQIAALRFVQNYVLFLAIICAKNLIECLVIRIIINKKFLKARDKTAELPQAEKLSVNKDMRYLMFSKVGDLLMYSTDSMIISKVISVALSGFYSNYYFVLSGIENGVYIIFDALMSRTGNKYVFSDNREKAFGYFRMCCINLVITSVCVSGLYWLSDKFITLWMGEDALLAHYVVVLSAMELYLQVTRRSIDVFRTNEGIFKEMTNIILFRGIFNVILSVVLGLVWGLAGIMAATVITDITTVYWYEPYLVYKKLQVKLRYEWIYQAVSLLTVIGSLVLSGWAIHLVTLSGWLEFIVQGLIIVACSLAFSGVISLLMTRWINRVQEKKEQL